MRAMDSRHDFTLEKVFWGYFGALDQKANSALPTIVVGTAEKNLTVTAKADGAETRLKRTARLTGTTGYALCSRTRRSHFLVLVAVPVSVAV
jgi:hypothetical protein